MHPSYPDSFRTETMLEFGLWAYLFGRIVEELEQLFSETETGSLRQRLRTYFASGWNQIDFVTIVIMLICFALRVLLWVDILPLATYPGTGGVVVLIDAQPGRLHITD